MPELAERASAVIREIDEATALSSPLAARLLRMAAHAARDEVSDETTLGMLSAGERLAVALVLDRHDWLRAESTTMLQAMKRLGPEWLEAAVTVQNMLLS
jgi:hypothetical protein